MGQWGSLVYPRGFGTLGPRFESALSHLIFFCFPVPVCMLHPFASAHTQVYTIIVYTITVSTQQRQTSSS